MKKELEDRLKAFEERNAPVIKEQNERERLGAICLFNMQELLFRTIAHATLEACKRLGIDPTDAHGEIVPNHETKKFGVALVLENDVAKIRAPENDQIQAVMVEEFGKANASLLEEREKLKAVAGSFPAGTPIDEDAAQAKIQAWFKARQPR